MRLTDKLPVLGLGDRLGLALSLSLSDGSQVRVPTSVYIYSPKM